MRHMADPRSAWDALPALAGLVSQRLLTLAEADAALADAGPAGDPSGWQARRRWALTDAVAVLRAARRRAGWAIRAALAPLLAARASRPDLEAAAAAADPAGALPAAQRAALVRDQVARALRATRP